MSKIYQYFTMPPGVPAQGQVSPSTTWFATWSTTPPALEPGMAPPCAIYVTENELPAGAIALGTGSKDPPAPPPPLTAGGMAEYQDSVRQWLEQSRDADE